jgi:hypothetical protein
MREPFATQVRFIALDRNLRLSLREFMARGDDASQGYRKGCLMRFLRPALAALLIGASAPSLIAPVLAQTCACPPADESTVAPNGQAYGPGAYRAGPLIVADEPPPPIPDYDQPPPPAPGYYWTPGYWAWNNDDYYWVPGVWVEPPQPGFLWTPGYWAADNGAYVYRRGYWGHRIGFYGGVNYGYGYFGRGYDGGRWDGDHFYYNSAVNNLGRMQPEVIYNNPVTINNTVVNNVAMLAAINNFNRASFVGRGGLRAVPTSEERAASAGPRLPPTDLQRQQVRAAAVNPQQFLDANRGKPPVAAMPRPGDFKAPGVIPARAVGGPIPQLGPNGQPGEKLPPEGKPRTPGQPPVAAPLGSNGQPLLPPGPKPPAPGQPIVLPPGTKTSAPAQQPAVQPAAGPLGPNGKPLLPSGGKPSAPVVVPPGGKPAASSQPPGGGPVKAEPLNPPKPGAIQPPPAAPKPLAPPKVAPPQPLKGPGPRDLGPQGLRPPPNGAPNGLRRVPGAQPLEGAVRPPPGLPAAQMKPPGQPTAPMIREPMPKPAAMAPRPEPGKPGGPPRCGLPGQPPCPH